MFRAQQNTFDDAVGKLSMTEILRFALSAALHLHILTDASLASQFSQGD